MDIELQERQVLILAPVGRDAVLAARIVASAGLAADVCADTDELRQKAEGGAGAILVTQEALSPRTLTVLRELSEEQPPWSDIPIIVCASQGALDDPRFAPIQRLRASANVTLVERPARSWTLASAVNAAVRARGRQYQMRDLFQQRDDLLRREQTARTVAEDANRAKDDFLAMVSHELRTPLNAMLGWTRMLRTRSMGEAQQARALKTIERNANSQRQLIEELLDVTRIISRKLRLSTHSVGVVAIVELALDAVRPTAEAKGLGLDVHLPDGEMTINGDGDRLVQVVSNLLTNAVKFTARGGRIGVRVLPGDGVVRIFVEDDGDGIPEDFMPHLFDRFRQADGSITRAHGGLGLGLAIARELVELHGGTIEASSDGKGRGARFAVTLPAGPARQPISDAPNRVGQGIDCPSELFGLRILVVDDDEDTLDMMSTVLTACSMNVRTARSAEAGLTMFREVKPDVLLSDLAMPGEDGYELIRKVRALPPSEGGRVPAVAVTAFARAEDRTRALAAGFHTHVSKPIEPAELLLVLARTVAPGRAS